MTATFNDLTERILPNESEQVRGFVLWNHTSFPFGGVLETARHLKRWDRQRRGGWSGCCLCGKPYRAKGAVVLGGECGGNKGCLTYNEIRGRTK